MKKLVALLVALTMVLSLTAVFADEADDYYEYDPYTEEAYSSYKEYVDGLSFKQLKAIKESADAYMAGEGKYYEILNAAYEAKKSVTPEDQTGTTEETTETTTTTYVVTVVTEETTLSFKKLDTMTEAATALLNDPTKLGLAEGKVAQEIMSVEIDTENVNLIKTTADMNAATGIEVILALTSEDSADAELTFIKAESVEKTEEGLLNPVYPAGTMDAATAAATITLIVVTDAME